MEHSRSGSPWVQNGKDLHHAEITLTGAAARDSPGPGIARAVAGRCGLLLLLGQERRHLAAGPEGVHHLGPGREGWRPSRCSRSSRATPSTSAWSSRRRASPSCTRCRATSSSSLAVYTILKKREFPQSKLLPVPRRPACALALGGAAGRLPERRRRPCQRPPADQGARSRRGRLARLQDHRGRPGRRPLPVAQGQQVQLLRRRGDAQLLRAEEVALHRHEDRHHADEEEQGRHLRRRSHADALPVRLARSSSIRSRSRRSRSRTRPRPSSTCRRRTRSICPAT